MTGNGKCAQETLNARMDAAVIDIQAECINEPHSMEALMLLFVMLMIIIGVQQMVQVKTGHSAPQAPNSGMVAAAIVTQTMEGLSTPWEGVYNYLLGVEERKMIVRLDSV